MTNANTTRPAVFEMVSNFNGKMGRARQYRICEPAGTYVIDATSLSGVNPGTSRHQRVQASIEDRWTGATPTDYRGRTVWRVTTKGASSHGGSTRIKEFDTLSEAERYVKQWSQRRWRVAR